MSQSVPEKKRSTGSNYHTLYQYVTWLISILRRTKTSAYMNLSTHSTPSRSVLYMLSHCVTFNA